MYKKFTVDMDTLTTTSDIGNYIASELAEFSHIMDVSVDSSGYATIKSPDCSVYFRLWIKPKGNSSYIYYHDKDITSSSSYSDSYTINGPFDITVFTNDDNGTFVIFLYSNFRIGFVLGNNNMKYPINGHSASYNYPYWLYFRTSYNSQSSSTANSIFYKIGCNDTNKCYLFNSHFETNYCIKEPYMLDLFDAALPIRLLLRQTCTIDNEKYVVVAQSEGNDYRNATLFKYTE